MNDKEIDQTKTDREKSFFENGIVIFLLGPLIFLVVVRFTGFQIFYHGHDSDERKKAVWLLASGSAFYLVVIVLFGTMA